MGLKDEQKSEICLTNLISHPDQVLIFFSKATGEELLEEDLSELQEALALVKVFYFSCFLFSCCHGLSLVKEEDNSLELTTLMDLLLGDLKKS